MEDSGPAEKWGIQEYSSEEGSGKLSWIVNKGLSVGKKILVTGFVISSAPLVLPPLIVISVIGFACSVPSGLFLASYACTDKLMSKLLPGSTPPHFLLDRGTPYSDEEVENNEEDVGLKGFIDVGKEEEEELEETGYQENVGVYEDEKEEEAEGIEVKIVSIGEEEEKPATEESGGQLLVDEVHAVIVDIAEDRAPAFTARQVIELSQNRDTEGDEELAKESRGLLEKIREEGMTDNGGEEKRSLEEPTGVAEEGDRKVEEIGMPSKNKNDDNAIQALH